MNRMILATVFVASTLVTGMLFTGIVLQDAEAMKPNPKVKPFKCFSSGTFTSDGIDSVTTGVGNCSQMGKITTSGDFTVTGVADVCLTIESTNSVLTAANGDQVNLYITGTQCFFDENGEPTAPVNFCQIGGAHTSTVDGDYDITDGDGIFTDADGSGDINSDVNHCDDPPNTDTFESTISGTIEYAASNKT